MKESTKHMKAFEYYFKKLEEENNTGKAIKKTAEFMGCTTRTIHNWAKRFNWEEKIYERNMKITAKIEEEQIRTFAENRKGYLKLSHKLLDKLINDKIPIHIESIHDLETVIKLCLTLQNIPSEIVQNQNININTTDYSKLFDKELMNENIKKEE